VSRYKLPAIAIAVVWASRVLPAGAKGLWEKHFYLDQGPEGCWMSSQDLALLLGGKQSSVETYRQRLVELGLLRKGLIRGVRRRWYLDFPSEVVMPIAETGKTKIPVHAIVGAANHLDRILLTAGGWKESRTGVRDSGVEREPPKLDPSPGLFEQGAEASESESRTGVRVGGSGGSSIENPTTPTQPSTSNSDSQGITPEQDDRRKGTGEFTSLSQVVDTVRPAWARKREPA